MATRKAKTDEEKLGDLYEALTDRTLILDIAQFTHKEVCEFSGVSYTALRNWLSDETLPFMGAIGRRGKPHARRLYTGSDVLKLCAVTALQKIGVPIRKAAILTFTYVEGRARGMLTDPTMERGATLILAPSELDDDWLAMSIYPGSDDPNDEELPEAFIVFNVDAFVMRVLTMLNDAVAGETQGDHAE